MMLSAGVEDGVEQAHGMDACSRYKLAQCLTLFQTILVFSFRFADGLSSDINAFKALRTLKVSLTISSEHWLPSMLLPVHFPYDTVMQ
jgi:hypothetical protein